MPGVSVCMGQGCRAPAQPWGLLLFPSPPHWMQPVSKSGLPLAPEVSKCEKSHRPNPGASSMVDVEGDRCVIVTLNVPGAIGLHFLRQPAVAPEARLNSHTLYSSFCQPNREPS